MDFRTTEGNNLQKRTAKCHNIYEELSWTQQYTAHSDRFANNWIKCNNLRKKLFANDELNVTIYTEVDLRKTELNATIHAMLLHTKKLNVTIYT